jgi:L-threonylcarbamoyladenylate synthase
MTQAPPILDATDAALARAATLLRDGRLVAFPTETVYGLGADATNDRAVAAIFALKGRPHFNPLIVHVAAVGAARELVALDARAERLAAQFWPGPLTLVLPRRKDCAVSLLASAGLDSLAVRVPAHPVAQALLRAAGRPLAAPSANPSGKMSPTTARHVVDGFAGLGDAGGALALVLDGGRCAIGLESTVVDLCGARPALLRQGGVTEEALAAAIGPLAIDDGEEPAAPRSPGQLLSHYAPERKLRIDAQSVAPDEALLAFGPAPLTGAAVTENLSPTGDLSEAAANLFALLRRLDRPDVTGIAAMPVPERGLGRAINDRLRRAATPP